MPSIEITYQALQEERAYGLHESQPEDYAELLREMRYRADGDPRVHPVSAPVPPDWWK